MLVRKLKSLLKSGRDEVRPPVVNPQYRILFVCMGNICRSPTAEGVFRKVLSEQAPDLRIEIDSAGTHAYHVGDAPDPRAIKAAQRRGVDLSILRARRVSDEDFELFDAIVAMDPLNVDALRDRAADSLHERISLLLEYSPNAGRLDVPDPYYGGAKGFEQVLDLVEEASAGLLEHIRRQLQARQG